MSEQGLQKEDYLDAVVERKVLYRSRVSGRVTVCTDECNPELIDLTFDDYGSVYSMPRADLLAAHRAIEAFLEATLEGDS